MTGVPDGRDASIIRPWGGGGIKGVNGGWGGVNGKNGLGEKGTAKGREDFPFAGWADHLHAVILGLVPRICDLSLSQSLSSPYRPTSQMLGTSPSMTTYELALARSLPRPPPPPLRGPPPPLRRGGSRSRTASTPDPPPFTGGPKDGRDKRLAQVGTTKWWSDYLRCQVAFANWVRASRAFALRITMSLRASAMRMTIFALPAACSL